MRRGVLWDSSAILALLIIDADDRDHARAAEIARQGRPSFVTNYVEVETHTLKDFSLCDALPFAVMERRSVRTAFSVDRHFRQYGRFEILGS